MEIQATLTWHFGDSDIEPNSLGYGGIGPDEDAFLVCWTDEHDVDHVEIDRWLGSMWKHRSPTYWAVIPLPSDS